MEDEKFRSARFSCEKPIYINIHLNHWQYCIFNVEIIGCLSENPSNEFYKHMGGKFVDTNPLTLPNGQELMENLYYYEI